MLLNKRADYDLGRNAVYIFVACVFLTFVFLMVYSVVVNAREKSLMTKDFIEGSAIKYGLINGKNCFRSEKYNFPVIDLNKFITDRLSECTKETGKSVKIRLYDKDKIVKEEIHNKIGGYKRRDDSALVLVDDNGLKLMQMRIEYGG